MHNEKYFVLLKSTDLNLIQQPLHKNTQNNVSLSILSTCDLVRLTYKINHSNVY